jgi:hypothetical protein
MTRPPAKVAIQVQDLMAYCPEAQADGVPCPSLGRKCEVCERAIAIRDRAARDGDPAGAADPSTI